MPSAEEAKELFTLTIVRGLIGWDAIHLFDMLPKRGYLTQRRWFPQSTKQCCGLLRKMRKHS